MAEEQSGLCLENGLWDHLVECAGGDAELDGARPPADVAGRAAAEGLGAVPQPHPFRKLRYRILRHKKINKIGGKL